MEYLWIPLITLFASFIHTSLGLGFNAITMAVLPLIMPYKSAQIVSILAALPTIVFLTIKNYKKIRVKSLILPTIFAVFATFLGITISKNFNESSFRLILGIMLIVISVYFLFFNERLAIKGSIPVKIAAGILSGVMGGFCDISSPPMALYLVSVTEDADEYSATMQFYLLIMLAVMLASHVIYGSVTVNMLKYSLVSYVGALIGTVLGVATAKLIPMKILKTAVYIIIGLLGVLMLILG